MVTDEKLVERLKKGNTRALDTLYRRYAKPLYAFCANIIGIKDSEDVVHDVFMRVIERIDSFNAQKASFNTWLYRIARNRCIDLVRHEKHLTMISLEKNSGKHDNPGAGSLKDMLADSQENVEQTLVRESEIEAVRDCINALQQEEEREAIVLYYLAGKVYREIGEVLGKSTSMAKNYVTAARDKVKRCLERKGF